MKPLIMLMLAAQALIVCLTVFNVLFRKPAAARPTPVWSNVVVPLMVVAGGSLSVADRHAGGQGADILWFGGAALFGMAFAMALVSLRARRSLPTP